MFKFVMFSWSISYHFPVNRNYSFVPLKKNYFLSSDCFFLSNLLCILLQSVLPGILQGDKSDSLLYGSVDNGKKICWNEEFHSKVRMHLKLGLFLHAISFILSF